MHRKALKCFSNFITTDTDLMRIKRQPDILKRKIHENIIRYLDFFEEKIPEGVRVYLLTKFYQVKYTILFLFKVEFTKILY